MMNEANGNEIGVDVNMDGTSGNLDVEPSTQPNENSSKKIELLELPKEMLEEILIYLEGKDMLKASHVCTLFASVVETAFARKYSKNWYSIAGSLQIKHTCKQFQKVMLNKYGGKMQKVAIFNGHEEEILELVEQKCANAKSLFLFDVSRIIMLKDLTEAYFEAIHNLDLETFAKFIDLNPQLEALQFQSNNNALLALLDGRLNSLKELGFFCSKRDGRLLSPIRLRSLETLQLHNTADFIRLLQSINCNQIKKLILRNFSDPNGDDVINEICQFESLVSLGLPNYRITLDEVSKLHTLLPRITEFSMGIADGETKLAEKILSITSMLPQLSKLTMNLGKDDFGRLSSELKSSANDFHARVSKSNTKIIVTDSFNVISITAEYFFMFKAYSVELHWMSNLDEKNVWRVLNSSRSPHTLKFVNHCADRTFDIAALAFADTKCLEFKSNGPISVKPNVSRYQDWFPRLKILKIHLERHSANDFLRNLEPNFCEQIEELWLDTKSDVDNPDMTTTLAKFRNLKSFHLAPLSIKFDAGRLFSVCQDLTGVKRI